MKINQKIIYVYMLIITCALSYDLYTELPLIHNAIFIPHFLLELAILIFSLAGLIYFFTQELKERQLKEKYKRQLSHSEKELSDTKLKLVSLKKELLKIIEDQFNQWAFTPAEKELGILLIKGLSFDQISEIRNTTSKTARKQAVSIYAKSNLKNRNELSAWFLEDLL